MNTHQSIFKDGQIVLKLSPVSPNLIMSLLQYSIKFSSQKNPLLLLKGDFEQSILLVNNQS